MSSNDLTKNSKDELLRSAFLKIKKENNELNEKILLLEKRLSLLESQNQISAKQSSVEIKPIDKKFLNIEKAKESLTPTEKEILQIFTMSKDKSYTYEDLSVLLGKSSNTVKAQIQSIIKKGIQLSFNQTTNNQRTYYLDNNMFELVIKTKN